MFGDTDRWDIRITAATARGCAMSSRFAVFIACLGNNGESCREPLRWIISSRRPCTKRTVDYDNLLYSCVTCNLNKGDLDVSDPLRTLISSTVYVARSGEIQSNSSEAAKLIELLRLNRPQYVEFRKLWINMVRLAADHDPELYQRLMQFPSELPDLQRLRPPGGNKRREGLEQSHFARREQGELPATY